MPVASHGYVDVERTQTNDRQWLAENAASAGQDIFGKEAGETSTISELCARFLDEYSSTRHKSQTTENNRRLIDRHILPALGSQRDFEVTRRDIFSLHHRMRETPYQANRVLSLISKMMKLAELWGIRPNGTNPTLYIEKYDESKRERILSAEELNRLWTSLSALEKNGEENPYVLAAIRLLIATRCRLSEILTLKWQWVDVEQERLNLPDGKSGTKSITLNGLAVNVLNGIAREVGNPYVIIGSNKGQHLVNLERPWQRICKTAALVGVRIHDLRHSCPSTSQFGRKHSK